MAEGNGKETGTGKRSGAGKQSRRSRQSGGEGKPERPATDSPGGPDSAQESSASRSTTDGDPGNPLGLEPSPPFVPPADEAGARPHVEPEPDYEPPPPELIEWTPERATSIVRAGGFLLHNADPLAHEDGGEQLWRATAEDCEAIAPPLARILNRYAPARRLAGKSDEVELTLALGSYARRNVAARGRLVRQLRDQAEHEAGAFETWPDRGEGTPPPRGGIEGTFGTGGEQPEAES